MIITKTLNDDIRKGYDKVADEYLKYRDQFKNNKYLDRLIAILPNHSTILDMGCGAGIPIDSYLISKGHKIIGIDISERQIELAKEYVPQAKYERKDMSLLGDGEYMVDAVISFYAIFHTPRETHLSLLKRMYSFLKKDGVLLVTMGSSDWVGTENDFCGGAMSWSHYDCDTNRELIKQAGFQILLDEVDTSGNEQHLVVLAKK